MALALYVLYLRAYGQLLPCIPRSILPRRSIWNQIAQLDVNCSQDDSNHLCIVPLQTTWSFTAVVELDYLKTD